jgi:hypothetical protein
MTYLELCQKLRREVGIAGTGPSSVSSQSGMMLKVVEWVADADVAIQSKWINWTFLWSQFTQDTIVSTKDVTKPTDLASWDEGTFSLDLNTTDYLRLTKMPYRTWLTYYRANTGKPTYFIVKPDKDVILEPVPDDVYALSADYWKRPTRLSDNADVSLIPDEFDRLIIAQAKIYYAEHENAPEIMQSAMMEYAELMHRMQVRYLPDMDTFGKSSDDNMVVVPE